MATEMKDKKSSREGKPLSDKEQKEVAKHWKDMEDSIASLYCSKKK